MNILLEKFRSISKKSFGRDRFLSVQTASSNDTCKSDIAFVTDSGNIIFNGEWIPLLKKSSEQLLVQKFDIDFSLLEWDTIGFYGFIDDVLRNAIDLNERDDQLIYHISNNKFLQEHFTVVATSKPFIVNGMMTGIPVSTSGCGFKQISGIDTPFRYQKRNFTGVMVVILDKHMSFKIKDVRLGGDFGTDEYKKIVLPITKLEMVGV